MTLKLGFSSSCVIELGIILMVKLYGMSQEMCTLQIELVKLTPGVNFTIQLNVLTQEVLHNQFPIVEIGWTLKLSCDSRFQRAFTACSCVFKVITLV